MAIIKTEDLIKNYGKFRALDGVDMEVDQGQVYGFIGPNGAGKTTTIRVLLGILKKSSGSATIFGKDAWKDAVEIHKRIAYVPGDVNLWDNLTGGEVIDLFVKLRKSGDKNKRDELIEKFNLDPSKKCRTYSKGNRQKVALVAAFSSDADLYILDEPTSGLDPLMERVFQECIDEIKEENKTVLLSSHILSEVEKLCDMISIIRKGKIIDSGTLSELRHLMRNRVVVETKSEMPELLNLPGVHDLENDHGVLSFNADGHETENIMNELSKHGIIRIQATPPTLEEMFMTHYKDDIKEEIKQEEENGGNE